MVLEKNFFHGYVPTQGNNNKFLNILTHLDHEIASYKRPSHSAQANYPPCVN